ncbi:MAG TPA: hypothetical protein VK307_05395 [Thermoleophilaceae bacterium]|nr:hypothetical protein [Thermoleophilaceae bacterium]
MPTFCRHNRFMADCPICSKGTVLDPDRRAERRPRAAAPGAKKRPGARRAARAASATRVSRGVYAAAGPYGDGQEVRLERVPGGLRLALWHAGQLVRAAPVISATELPGLLAAAVDKELLSADETTLAPCGTSEAAQPGTFGASPGRSGELREELRVERFDAERLRIARWLLRPGRGWELQEAPVMLPAKRFAQALAAAAGRGVLSDGPAG